MANNRLILRNGAVADSSILAVDGGASALPNASEDDIHIGITSAPNPNLVVEYGFTGEVLAGQSTGSGATKGNVCYLRTNGQWYLADASQVASGDALLGIALNTAASGGGKLDILIRGIIGTNSTMLTSIGSGTGQPIYLATTGGTMSQTAPSSSGNIVRILGHYINLVGGETTKYVMSFNPDSIWLEL